MSILKDEFGAGHLLYWMDKTSKLEKSLFKRDIDPEKLFNERFPYFSIDMSYNSTQIKNALKQYEKIDGDSSFYLNRDELNTLISELHTESFLHYLYAENFQMKNHTRVYDFPNGCCFHSSQNIFLSNLIRGNPLGKIFWSENEGHAFYGIPFVLKEDGETGIVVLDPTSDQLEREYLTKKIMPRNLVFVTTNDNFNYRTNWDNGRGIFPQLYLGLKEVAASYFKENLAMNDHAKTVIKNSYKKPIDINQFKFWNDLRKTP